MSETVDYRMRLVDGLEQVAVPDWNALAAAAGTGRAAQPFVRHEFLHALETSACVGPGTGWLPRHLLLEDHEGRLRAAVPLYLKEHSYGEYVFDWAWAEAFERSGQHYHPKLVCAVPFTPVTGPRLLAADGCAAAAAARTLLGLAADSGLSSLHVLFPTTAQAALLAAAGMMGRRGIQFHWRNRGWTDFETFLASLSQPKRKKIRSERRKIASAGLAIERRAGAAITAADWEFFFRCYRDTCAGHGSHPYLNLGFFERIGAALPEHLVMVMARKAGRPVACSLFLADETRLYGRYWGSLAQVDFLHFELCYYQAIELAIERGLAVVEGGAQGEHKMARGFEATETVSAHWLAEPGFADAVGRFLEREGGLTDARLERLGERSPYRR